MAKKQIETDRNFFDYNALDKPQRAQLRSAATAIKAAFARTQNDILEIGRRLEEVRDSLEYGLFCKWIDAEFSMGQSTAYQFIAVANKFGTFPNFGKLDFQQSALYALAANNVPDNIRAEAVARAEAGETITHATAKAMIAESKAADEDDFDDSDPYADDFDTTDGDGEPAAPEPETTPPDALTPKQKAARATVVHDTLPKAPKPAPSKAAKARDEDDLTDDEWLETIPAYGVLKRQTHKGISARSDMLGVRTLIQTKALSNFNHHASRAFSLKAGLVTPAARVVADAANLPHPKEWLICSPCRGAGCQTCKQTGYGLHAGIDPARLEGGES